MNQRLRVIIDVFLLVVALVAAAALPAWAMLRPVQDAETDLVLVIAPPWGVGAGTIVQHSGGRIVGPVSAPFATLANFDAVVPVGVLRENGAWAVRDARQLAQWCGEID